MEQAMIGAIINNDDVDVDALIRNVVSDLQGDDHQLLGLIQSGGNTGATSRCAGMEVNFIGTNRVMGISQNLGASSGACCLDTSQLTAVAGLLKDALDDDDDVSDLLILSRFGKSEAAGGGLIDCASHAVAMGVPVLMAVGPKHLDAWRQYQGGMGIELDPDHDKVTDWCRRVIGN